MIRTQNTSKRTLINEAIPMPNVRLIDADGNQVGIVSKVDALAQADAVNLDLVLIAEQSDPPVAKIMDYGKHVFEKKKARTAAKRKQKQIQVKEVKFRPATGDGDYQIKLRNLVRFLKSGDKAKVTLRFKGREMMHKELGMEVMKRIEQDLVDYGSLKMEPKLEGRQLSMIFAPKSKKG